MSYQSAMETLEDMPHACSDYNDNGIAIATAIKFINYMFVDSRGPVNSDIRITGSCSTNDIEISCGHASYIVSDMPSTKIKGYYKDEYVRSYQHFV